MLSPRGGHIPTNLLHQQYVRSIRVACPTIEATNARLGDALFRSIRFSQKTIPQISDKITSAHAASIENTPPPLGETLLLPPSQFCNFSSNKSKTAAKLYYNRANRIKSVQITLQLLTKTDETHNPPQFQLCERLRPCEDRLLKGLDTDNNLGHTAIGAL